MSSERAPSRTRPAPNLHLHAASLPTTTAMSWYQYSNAQAYPQFYQTQEPYTAQSYQQAWYNYFQQHPHARPTAQVAQVGTPTTSTTSTVPVTSTSGLQMAQIPTVSSGSTFSTYNPNQSYSNNAGVSSSGTKGSGKKSALKGLFAKERECHT